MIQTQGPVTVARRLVSLDVLRGFALLGILMMNIQSFGLLDVKYLNPMAMGELSPTSYACWWFAHVFFDSKFMALFSMMFGAGVVLMWERAKAANRGFGWLHYRRMFWLLLFGLAHAHLIWIGDVLYTYSLSGMVVYWLCGLRPRWLILIGTILLTIGSGLSVLSGFSIPFMDPAQLAEMKEMWQPSAAGIEMNLETYRGSWMEQQPHRSEGAFGMETFLFLFLFFWRASGLMLIGMAIFKMNIFSAERSNKFYALGATIGLLIGLPLVIFGVQMNNANDWQLEYSFFFGVQPNYWGSISVSFAYVCLLMLFFRAEWGSWLKHSLAAVGRMALTNYIAHSVICTLIFYGHGLGWFGYLSRLELIGVVLAIWLLQLIISPIWLSYFRFGPLEWLWRSLSYWRIQPLRHSP